MHQKHLKNNNSNQDFSRKKRFNSNVKAPFFSQAKESLNKNEIILCGKHAVFSALEKKRRKIFEIFVTENSATELENFLNKNSLEKLKNLVRRLDNRGIENLLGEGQIHQGIAIRATKLPLKTQNDLLEELCELKENSKLPTLILLDQISDPHNVGAIIRSAIGFGVTKIIFCEHNAPKENATIVKSSAGTIEMADLIVVTNFSNLLEKLKKIGYWCIGLAGEAKHNITEIKEYKNIALVVGSEGDGIRDLVKKNCDLLAKIQMNNEVESLNASVAAAIALYEISKS
jgi:23S rRNA (guanosine2251-2'-O)-methyltransferase